MQNLTVVIQNNTSESAGVCLYRTFANSTLSPIAWLTDKVNWGKSKSIDWNEQWQFVWAQTQSVANGVVLTVGAALDAELPTSNQVSLSYSAADGFFFHDQSAGYPTNALVIRSDGTIPPNQVATGLGMANAMVAAVMMPSNMVQNWALMTEIWIAAGDFQAGEILAPATITGAAQIVFPVNTLSMTATLNADGSWSIAPTPL